MSSTPVSIELLGPGDEAVHVDVDPLSSWPTREAHNGIVDRFHWMGFHWMDFHWMGFHWMDNARQATLNF